MGQKFFSGLQWLLRPGFGRFEPEEFKKFLKLGAIFACIIGSYWTLRPLKDVIFIQFVGKLYIPYAKTVSVLALFPIVMLYTKLLNYRTKERMIVILASFYAVLILLFASLIYCIQDSVVEIAASSVFAGYVINVIGFAWYLFVESYGSLVIALFWAFATGITDPQSGRKGFSLVVALGQGGGVIFPYTVGSLPSRLGFSTDTLSLCVLSMLVFMIIPLIRFFLSSTPDRLMQPFTEEGEVDNINKEKPGFLEGLRLVIKNPYLLGIFSVNFIYEIIITIFDFNFKVAASTEYTGVELSKYLSLYGSSVSLVSFLCLMFGIGGIMRILGVGFALVLMPIIVGFALTGFLTFDSLNFLFCLMVGSKAINYALNGPALKQLYIPTSSDVRSKAQAWIEAFGSRSSKQAGSVFNMFLAPFQSLFGPATGRLAYLALSGVVCFPLLVVWLFIAVFLGKAFKKAVREKVAIC
ncbi:MAG: hypothetical protein A3F09_00835 [Chlamydiae bacterium RIFCSPHIGHO2_12_FULL_49_11]|nr:MAG: hypothetical protein A3F09_00835 [Chlamydiae bacterium RIFCSPHIGHO2_12_FULL_49_11]